MIRAVLDPGVLLSALLSRSGGPAHLVGEWLRGGFELVVCPTLLGEVDDVLGRPYFRERLSRESSEAYVHLLRRFADVRPDPEVEAGLTPDPDDDYLVALSRDAPAHVLVSGDSHLVDLTRPLPPILTPRAFLEALEDPSGLEL